MAALGKIKIEVTPEIQEAINYITPVAVASAAFFDCLYQNQVAVDDQMCRTQLTDLGAMTANYAEYIRTRTNSSGESN